MADEEKIEEEVKTEETVTEESTDENSEEILDVMTDFDKKLDSDDDDSTDEDGGDVQTEEEDSAVEDKTVEKTEEGKTDEAIEAEIAALEKEAEEVVVEKKVEEKAEETEDGKFVSKLDPAVWDEDAIKIDTERGQAKMDLEAANKRNEDLSNRLDNAEMQRYTDWIDSRFSKLGDEYADIFGEGDFEDIEPGSEFMENRGKIENRMNLIQQAYVNQKKQSPSRNQLFQKAVEREFKDKINKSKKTEKNLEDRAGQVVGKGSKKSSALSAGDELDRIHADFDAKLDEDD